MNELNSYKDKLIQGVTPFPEEPHEFALVLYETCDIQQLQHRLNSSADQRMLKHWNLTAEQYHEEVLLAKRLLEAE